MYRAGTENGGAGTAQEPAGGAGAGEAGAMLLRTLSETYERGWQPQDILHVSARQLRLHRPGPLVALILAHAYRNRALDRAPDDWADQLRSMALAEPAAAAAAGAHADPDDPPADIARCTDQLSTHALALLWQSLPGWPHLCPPPSQWPARRDPSAAAPSGAGDAGGPSQAVDPKILGRIRGLLAKAESTDFPDEAEALSTKAQQLITRHAIDTALLHRSTAPEDYAVSARRIHLDNPYLREKVHLLTEIGRVNTTRTVWSERLAIATVIGPAGEIAQVELLFTSLLVQATRAMRAQSRRSSAPGRTTAFRRSFLMGFAVRIGERLREAHEQAARAAAEDADDRTPGQLVPVMRARAESVRREAERLFPRTRPMRAHRVDTTGWTAGTGAADAATLTAGGTRIGGHEPLASGRRIG